MAFDKRAPANAPITGIGNGPYLAKVVSHLDPSYMGTLEVTLLRKQGNTIGDDNQTYVVRFASPFAGATSYDFMGPNVTDFNDTQKSYGMWFVPPDVGVTVMVVFVDSNPGDGYWIACIPSRFVNNMIPGIASSDNVALSEADKKKYAPATRLPIAELNRRANTGNTNTDIDKIKKPVHPMADKLLESGLLIDDIRGSHNSSARRDIPSMVFGISTPGPLDRRNQAKRATIGKILTQSPSPVPVSRLGGSQFIMDDGDDQYQRKTSAGTGPVDYADILAGETGQPDIPYGESFRIRTRTGHQILLHNSEDLIYIGNAKGTTWVELTSNGKIDIYAKDSVSIHTENDLNIAADRDINLEAGRNFNVKAGGRFHAEAGKNLELISEATGFITIKEDFNLFTGKSNKFTAGTDTHIGSTGNHTETAKRIDMNGPRAETAELAEFLSTHDNPKTDPSAGWNKLYQSGVVSSIMKRVPMHEPWLLHENQAPQLQTPGETDRET
jgi:hypothetical protein